MKVLGLKILTTKVASCFKWLSVIVMLQHLPSILSVLSSRAATRKQGEGSVSTTSLLSFTYETSYSRFYEHVFGAPACAWSAAARWPRSGRWQRRLKKTATTTNLLGSARQPPRGRRETLRSSCSASSSRCTPGSRV
jgi:hypothetical protein